MLDELVVEAEHKRIPERDATIADFLLPDSKAQMQYDEVNFYLGNIMLDEQIIETKSDYTVPTAAQNPESQTVGDYLLPEEKARMQCRDVNVYYSGKQAINDVSLDIGNNEILAMIGPSGCGKSTFLRCLNRMNDTIDTCRVTGSIKLEGQDIYAPEQDVVPLRVQVGMVFQKPNPFPKSIYDNIAYGPRIHGLAQGKTDMDEIVETSLQKAGLWNEVKDSLQRPGTALSGGQQQRLCIARTIAINPEVILMDEPCSALDPIATAKIEELMDELRQNYTIAIVTHSMQQAARVSQRTAYFHLGDLVEVGATADVFNNPKHQLTEDYITGRFG